MDLKPYLFVLVSLGCSIAFSQKNVAIINDPSGFAYLKAQPNPSAKNIHKILKDQQVLFTDSLAGDWVPVVTVDEQQKGFMLKSKIRPIDQVKVKNNSYNTATINHYKIQERHLGHLRVRITELSTKDSGCQAWVDVYHGQKLHKSFYYKRMESMGGIAGLTFLQKVDSTYLFVVKHGDYEGKSIYIHKNGTCIETKGGIATKALHKRYVLNFHECDIGYCGYTLLDLHTHSVIAEQNDLYISEVFDDGGQVIFNTAQDGYQLKRLNIPAKKLEPYAVAQPESLKRFDRFIPYEHDDPCFCNCKF